eukprot:178388-Rhodomonas_salina.1
MSGIELATAMRCAVPCYAHAVPCADTVLGGNRAAGRKRVGEMHTLTHSMYALLNELTKRRGEGEVEEGGDGGRGEREGGKGEERVEREEEARWCEAAVP